MVNSKKCISQVAFAALVLFVNVDSTTPIQTDSNGTSNQINSTDAVQQDLNNNETLNPTSDVGRSTSNDTIADSPDMSNNSAANNTVVDSNTSKTVVSPLADWPEDKCIDNLTNIYEDIGLKGAFEMKTYHICPNTTYVIGTPDGDGNCCEEGKHRPLMMRSYAEYVCGDDGKSSNNCILTGGQVHVITTQHEWVGEPSKALKLRGFTFEKAEMVGVFLSNEGDVEFIDCVFKDYANVGAIVLSYNPLPFENRRLHETDNRSNDYFGFPMNSYTRAYLESHPSRHRASRHKRNNYMAISRDREMITSATDDIALKQRCLVTFDGCVFLNNTLGPSVLNSQNGVIMVEKVFHDVVFKKCLFMENNFNYPDEVSEGYAIRIQTANTLVMDDCCFIKNQFFGGGAVNLNETVIEGLANNYVSSDSSVDLECPFAYDEAAGECIQANASTCTLLEIPTLDGGTNMANSDQQSCAFFLSHVASILLLLSSIISYL